MDAAAFGGAWRAGSTHAQTGRLPDTLSRTRDAAGRLGVEARETTLRRVAANEERTLRDATALHADALPALRALARNPALPLALVSNASPAAEALLDSLGLRRYFAATAWSFRVGVLKPDAAIYRAACRALGMLSVRITRVMSLPSDSAAESRAWDVAIDDLRDIPGLLAGAGAPGATPSR